MIHYHICFWHFSFRANEMTSAELRPKSVLGCLRTVRLFPIFLKTDLRSTPKSSRHEVTPLQVKMLGSNLLITIARIWFLYLQVRHEMVNPDFWSCWRFRNSFDLSAFSRRYWPAVEWPRFFWHSRPASRYPLGHRLQSGLMSAGPCSPFSRLILHCRER